MKMTHHGHNLNRHYPHPFMGGGGATGAGGRDGGHRRRTERSKGPGEDSGTPSLGNKEKSSSNTGSIDVIPEDQQFQGSCPPSEANLALASTNSGSAVPSEEEGSHYTKGGEFYPDNLYSGCKLIS